jgi:hypothetical protein
LICAGALADLGAQAWIRARAPSEGDWRHAASYLRQARRDGDGFVAQPGWSAPIARLHLGDLVPVEEAARPDRSRQGRVWEVGPAGARRPATAGRVAEERRFGGVLVRRVEREPAVVLYDFTAHGRDAAPAVEARVAEVAFAPVLALPAPPPRTLAFRDVPLGGRLALHTGIHDFQSRYHSDVPVTLVVRVDGVEAGRVVHGNDDGWRPAAIDTSRWAGSPHAVSFEVRAARAAHRTFVFHAEARR